jgi:hypothetical protein
MNPMYKNALSGLASGYAAAKKPIKPKAPVDRAFRYDRGGLDKVAPKSRNGIIKIDPRESDGTFNKKPNPPGPRNPVIGVPTPPKPRNPVIGVPQKPKQPKPGMGTPPSIQNPANSIKNEKNLLAERRQNPSKPRRAGQGGTPPRMY